LKTLENAEPLLAASTKKSLPQPALACVAVLAPSTLALLPCAEATTCLAPLLFPGFAFLSAALFFASKPATLLSPETAALSATTTTTAFASSTTAPLLATGKSTHLGEGLAPVRPGTLESGSALFLAPLRGGPGSFARAFPAGVAALPNALLVPCRGASFGGRPALGSFLTLTSKSSGILSPISGKAPLDVLLTTASSVYALPLAAFGATFAVLATQEEHLPDPLGSGGGATSSESLDARRPGRRTPLAGTLLCSLHAFAGLGLPPADRTQPTKLALFATHDAKALEPRSLQPKLLEPHLAQFPTPDAELLEPTALGAVGSQDPHAPSLERRTDMYQYWPSEGHIGPLVLT